MAHHSPLVNTSRAGAMSTSVITEPRTAQAKEKSDSLAAKSNITNFYLLTTEVLLFVSFRPRAVHLSPSLLHDHCDRDGHSDAFSN